jgi:hypothetical protein
MQPAVPQLPRIKTPDLLVSTYWIRRHLVGFLGPVIDPFQGLYTGQKAEEKGHDQDSKPYSSNVASHVH